MRWPQSGQYFAVPGRGLPHCEQLRVSGAAHSSQNFAPARFSCWQRGHFMPLSRPIDDVAISLVLAHRITDSGDASSFLMTNPRSIQHLINLRLDVATKIGSGGECKLYARYALSDSCCFSHSARDCIFVEQPDAKVCSSRTRQAAKGRTLTFACGSPLSFVCSLTKPVASARACARRQLKQHLAGARQRAPRSAFTRRLLVKRLFSRGRKRHAMPKAPRLPTNAEKTALRHFDSAPAPCEVPIGMRC